MTGMNKSGGHDICGMRAIAMLWNPITRSRCAKDNRDPPAPPFQQNFVSTMRLPLRDAISTTCATQPESR
jgi:hypothetical protein